MILKKKTKQASKSMVYIFNVSISYIIYKQNSNCFTKLLDHHSRFIYGGWYSVTKTYKKEQE